MKSWKDIYNVNLGVNNCNVLGAEATVFSELINEDNLS